MNVGDQSADAAQVIQLDAAAVAATPVLGYHFGEFVVATADPGQSVVREPMPQRWITSSATSVEIDVEFFHELKPFDALLGDGATTSTLVESVSDELAGNWTLPTVAAEQLGSAAAITGVSVAGRGFASLVWADGLIISAFEPFATTIQLLIKGFSEQARHEHVHADRQKLQSALDLLPPEVRREYVPDAETYLTEAATEMYHKTAMERQRRLKDLRGAGVKFVDGKLRFIV